MKLLVGLLGFLDLNAFVLLVALAFGAQARPSVLIFFAACMFAKACIALEDPGGAMDLGAATLLILSIFFKVPVFLMLVGAGFIGFKALRSFSV